MRLGEFKYENVSIFWVENTSDFEESFVAIFQISITERDRRRLSQAAIQWQVQYISDAELDFRFLELDLLFLRLIDHGGAEI